jgi:hypothetical protein
MLNFGGFVMIQIEKMNLGLYADEYNELSNTNNYFEHFEHFEQIEFFFFLNTFCFLSFFIIFGVSENSYLFFLSSLQS